MKLDRFQPAEETPFFPLTALVDVLFFMVIFLVLGASFDTVETAALPEAQGALPEAQGALPEAQGAQVEAGALAVQLLADGSLALDGRPLPAPEAVALLRSRHPQRLLLLPDPRGDIGSLFRWVDRLQRELGIEVRVGVRPPQQ